MITEGQVQAGDEIVRTHVGRHALSVADVDALLYLPGRDIERLRAVVDLPALSPGWQQSFRELLDNAEIGTRADAPSTGPGRSGFHRLRVAEIVAESSTVTSLYLSAEDGDVLPEARAGQHVTLIAAGAGDPPPVRSYSLSSSPGADTYRISVKREPLGVVSGYLHSQRPGSALEVAAPRGRFVLTDDSCPVLLISAGIGVTPVLAMLHHLAAASSTRDVWWIHTARDPNRQAFADEAHRLLQPLPRAHERIFYTSVEADPPPTGPVIRGRPTLAALAGLGLPVDPTAYICGPSSFMTGMRAALVEIAIAPDRLRTETSAHYPPSIPDSPTCSTKHPVSRPDPQEPGRRSRSRAAVSPCVGPTGIAPCSSWPTPATFPPDGPAEQASATPASPRSSPGTSPTPPPPWSCPQATRR